MSTFGNPGSSSSQGGSIFGGNNAATAPGTASTTAPSLFGAKPAAGGSFFGGGAATGAGTGGGLFGSTPASGGSLFGGAASSSTPTHGFGSANTSSSAGTTSTPPVASTTTPTSFFGGSPFSLPKPGDQTSAAPKPMGSSAFNSQPSTLNSGGLFGLPTKPADATTTPSAGTAPSAGSIFSGGGFSSKPTGTATNVPLTATSTTTTAPPASGSVSGGNKDATPGAATAAGGIFSSLGGAAKPAENKDATASASAPPPTFNLFGASKAEEKKDSAAAAGAPAPTFSLGQPASKDAPKSTDTLALTTTSGTTTTSTPIAVPPPSMLRGKTIEEIVNRWSSELENHVREFNRFAGEVAVWDRALIDNGNNLAALYSHVQAAEREQNDIEQSLDHIEQQQRELSSTLVAYEKVTQEILGSQGGSLRALDTGPADTERDKNYMLATDLHTHLDDLSGSLTQMIDSVNALSLPSNDSASTDDPMAQIAQILSSHLESLQWIDGAVREVESKVSEVEKRVKDSGHSGSSGIGQKSRGFGLNR